MKPNAALGLLVQPWCRCSREARVGSLLPVQRALLRGAGSWGVESRAWGAREEFSVVSRETHSTEVVFYCMTPSERQLQGS